MNSDFYIIFDVRDSLSVSDGALDFRNVGGLVTASTVASAASLTFAVALEVSSASLAS
jgi:hypothetical protein